MGTYRISQLAGRVGVPASTLRFYEKEGLLPAERSAGGYRVYDDTDAERIRLISAGKYLGLRLDQIRRLLAAWDRGRCTEVRDELRCLVDDQITAADRRVDDLRAFRGRLTAVATHLGELPATPGPCGPACELPPARRFPDDEDRPPGPGPFGTADPAAPPVACSLDAGQHLERVRSWRTVLAGADREQLGAGLWTIRLPAARAGELAELVVAEHECCPFLAFRLSLAGERVELEVRAPEPAEALLAELFAS